MQQRRGYFRIVKHTNPSPRNKLHVTDSRTVNSIAFASLATFSLIPSRLRELVIRMALTTNTAGSKAIWYALMATSSLQRHGLQSQAERFKLLAIRALAASVNSGALEAAAAAQHVTANMLLGSFEVSHRVCTRWENMLLTLYYSKGPIIVRVSWSVAVVRLRCQDHHQGRRPREPRGADSGFLLPGGLGLLSRRHVPLQHSALAARAPREDLRRGAGHHGRPAAPLHR